MQPSALMLWVRDKFILEKLVFILFAINASTQVLEYMFSLVFQMGHSKTMVLLYLVIRLEMGFFSVSSVALTQWWRMLEC